jgi:putative endonuclease
MRNSAESRARRHYRLRGYRILDTNCWLAGYELDLVVRRGRWLAFCEVKSKSGPRWGDPAEMVTPEKQRRLRVAAQAWLARHPEHSRCRVRFDVVSESGRALRRLEAAF